MPTMTKAHIIIVKGFLNRLATLASIAVTASWLRSSMSGIATTLTANTIVAKSRPTHM